MSPGEPHGPGTRIRTAAGQGSLVWPPGLSKPCLFKVYAQRRATTNRGTHTHTHASAGDQSKRAAIGASPRGRAAGMSALSLSIRVTMTRFSLERCTLNDPRHLGNTAETLCSCRSSTCAFTPFPRTDAKAFEPQFHQPQVFVF